MKLNFPAMGGPRLGASPKPGRILVISEGIMGAGSIAEYFISYATPDKTWAELDRLGAGGRPGRDSNKLKSNAQPQRESRDSHS